MSDKSYSEMTTAERRSDGAKRAAKSRAEMKLWATYADKFGGVSGFQTLSCLIFITHGSPLACQQGIERSPFGGGIFPCLVRVIDRIPRGSLPLTEGFPAVVAEVVVLLLGENVA